MKHFKKFDRFGEKFSFNYHGYDKFSTRVGGFIYIIFFITTLFFIIIGSIPFWKSKKFSLQINTIQKSTEQINFNQNFFFGIDCGNESETEKANELFYLDVKYVKIINGNKKNIIVENVTCNSENCSYLTTNDIDSSIFKYIKKNSSLNVEGIYTDKSFTYFRIAVNQKTENTTEIKEFLKDKD